MSFLINPYRFGGFAIDVIAAGVVATTNPNGAFSYIRKATTTSTSVTLQTYGGSPGYFTGPESFSIPLIHFTAGDLFLHPGGLSAAVGVRWTSPMTGTVAVSGRFVKDNTTGASNGVNVSVYKNNTTTVVAPALINSASSIYAYTNVQVSVSAGDTLDFLIDNNGAVSSDHTNCTILSIVQL